MKLCVDNFQANLRDWWLRYLLWNCTQMNATCPDWQQAITWANVDQDLCRHMVSLAHNELRKTNLLIHHREDDCMIGTWGKWIAICRLRFHVHFLAATKQLFEWFSPSVHLSICLCVSHTFLTMLPSSYHHKIFRSCCQWQKWCPCNRSWS